MVHPRSGQLDTLNVLDTFAGAGGFSLGFEMAGCHIAGAIEIDKWASETFSFNHPDATVLTSDIQDLTDDDLRANFRDATPDIVLGGPPCQGYSVCVKDSGDPSDPRNTLFIEFLRVVRVFQPKIVIMENVPNISIAVTAAGESVVEIIKGELRDAGYTVAHRILEATDFGIPQMRKRLFIVGTARQVENPFPPATHCVGVSQGRLLDAPLAECPTLWDAISDLPELGAGAGEQEQEITVPPLNPYQQLLRDKSHKAYNHVTMHHSRRIVERFAAMTCGQSVADVPAHLGPLKRNGNGAASKQGYDQNNRRMFPDRPCHTIPASFYANFVHPFQHRNFTPREGARIQSFSDGYVFKGKPTVVSQKLLAREGRSAEQHLCQYNQIGNAVPPLLAKAIAANLINQM